MPCDERDMNLSDLNHFLVGGAVRDQLLNHQKTDRDYVVIGETPRSMIQRGFKPVGKSFPVFLHPITQEEYALARTEKKISSGHDGFTCNADQSVTLEQDLCRRDLTINAMAQDNDGHIIDPYGGMQDLKDGVLRHVSEAFSEDPLRILRVARFAARLPNFTVHPTTMKLMQDMVNHQELLTLSGERLWRELSRAILEAMPCRFFEVLKDCNALSLLKWQQLEHQKISQLNQLPNELTHRFAGICYSLDSTQLTLLYQQLKPPKHCIQLSALINQLQSSLDQVNLPASGLKMWQQLDPIRQPNRFQSWIHVMHWIYTQDQESLRQLKNFQKISEGLASLELPKSIKCLPSGSLIKQALFDYRLNYYQSQLTK
jgi:tRNA nucleotidyltransferase (CCA-adding enzyme)